MRKGVIECSYHQWREDKNEEINIFKNFNNDFNCDVV